MSKTDVRLRKRIMASLRQQGFQIRDGLIEPTTVPDKDIVRSMHAAAVKQRRDAARAKLVGFQDEMIRRIAPGAAVVPRGVSPRLIEVERGSADELLFRYAALHWSIPVSSGYGRRLRFLVVDDANGYLIGIIGLGDPVYSLKARDSWIGWSDARRRMGISHMMDAFVLGAVPPYSSLLGGKLVALIAASLEVREAFRRKYAGTTSLISGRRHDGRLALLTTTSALGRSSVYNRLRMGTRHVFVSVGFTSGSGEFHFSNGVYDAIKEYSLAHCDATARSSRWGGSGFRNRREVVKKCLSGLGLRSELIYHGVLREIFAVPYARNSTQFLRGEHERLQWYPESVADIGAFFRERWLIPRAQRDCSYQQFEPSQWRLWL